MGIKPIENHKTKKQIAEYKNKEQQIQEFEKYLKKLKDETNIENDYLHSLDNKIVELQKYSNDTYSKQIKLINDFLKKIEEVQISNKKELEDIQIKNKQEIKDISDKNEEEFIAKKNKLEEDINEQKKLLEQEKEELEFEHELFLEELEKRKLELEKEYNELNLQLQNDYNEKYNNLDRDYKTKFEELEEESNSREAFLNDYQEEIESENQRKYNELMGKVIESKNKFEIFMEEQKAIFKKEMEEKNLERAAEFESLSNQLNAREEEIENNYKNKISEYKKTEIELLKKETEIIEKSNILNEKVDIFNRKKKKFVKRHYILHILKAKVEKHKKKTIAILSLLIILSFYFSYVFEYTLDKKTFISNSLSKQFDMDSYVNTYAISLDTSQSVMTKFTDLDNLNLKIALYRNSSYLEDYKNIKLETPTNTFTWERFYKNNTLIAKSASDGQYIIVDDMDEYGFSNNRKDTNKIISTAIKEYLSNANNSDYVAFNRLNVLSKNNFVDYLKDIFVLSSNYEYFYEINKPSQDLFEEVFVNLINSDNYKSFLLEESKIQESLKLTDNLSSSRTILENILQYSKVNNTDVNIKILKGNKIGTIDIKFSLSYKDNTMANEVPIYLRLSCNYDSLDDTSSLEKDKFTLNSVYLDKLSPRQKTNDFQELESSSFEEQSTTFKNLNGN